jgi:hypothetical protein
MKRICLVLFDMKHRIFGPYLAPLGRIIHFSEWPLRFASLAAGSACSDGLSGCDSAPPLGGASYASGPPNISGTRTMCVPAEYGQCVAFCCSK